MRESRKLEHIRWALSLPDGPVDAGFKDVKIVHNSLPGLNRGEVQTAVKAFGCELAAPVLINALTGGNPEVREINQLLARAACKTGFGIAVGSQTGAVLAPELIDTFAVVRRENPNGLVIANVGANVSPSLALQAVEMLQANALQVHINVPQELAMFEGDRDFRGMAENIRNISSLCPVPVIVKEVGFGLSREAARTIERCGVGWVDVGGAGGTNFVAIEHRRAKASVVPEDWGIPTIASLLEVLSLHSPLQVIASGGIRSALDSVKVLALGASLVGIAGIWLKTLLEQSFEELLSVMTCFQKDLRDLMLLVGAKNIADLPTIPLVITGFTREWLQERGVDTRLWAQRD